MIVLTVTVLIRWTSYLITKGRVHNKVLIRGTVTLASQEQIMLSNVSASVNKQRVLILSVRSLNTPNLLAVLEGNRIAYDIHYLSAGSQTRLPSLTERYSGKYVAILFTRFSHYYELNVSNKRALDNYCRTFGVGMILFNQWDSSITTSNMEALPFKVYTNTLQFNTYRVTKKARILRLVKGNNILDFNGIYDRQKWSIFIPKNNSSFNQNFEVVAASNFIDKGIKNTIISGNSEEFPVVLHDLGKHDNIQRVFFGAGLGFWPHKLLFLDALGFVSRNKLAKSLDRWIQVDIDDIFMAKIGSRMKKEDVKASTQ